MEVEAEKIVRFTSKAVLIRFKGHDTWIPKSQLRSCVYFRMGDTFIVLDVDRRFARKEGLW